MRANASRGNISGVARLNDEDHEPVVVPHEELTTDVLRRVVESFVLREGTDYGQEELSLDQKVTRVMHQLHRGEAQIVFDPQSQTVDVLLRTAPRRKR
jgi:uncharacterized protein YheU (UPF0270 family)